MLLTIPKVFSPDYCRRMIQELDASVKPWKPSPRKVIDTAIIPKQQFALYHQKLSEIVKTVNSKAYQMDIDGLTDDPVIVRYSQGSYFDWHHDLNSGREGVHRKFTVIAALSDPNDYDGGDFYYFDHGERRTKLEQGSVIMFPAWLQHKVGEITRGARYTAVAFVAGPKIR